MRNRFRHHGKNLKFDVFGIYSYKNISVGNDVYIGPGACLIAADARIEIKDKVMMGPRVMMIAGNHRIDVIGQYMKDVTVEDKRDVPDKGITVEDDVWIGAGAIIMDGVTLGRGSVVAAGAVVTRSTEPYTVVAGVPARKIKKRFNDADINLHESLLSRLKD